VVGRAVGRVTIQILITLCGPILQIFSLAEIQDKAECGNMQNSLSPLESETAKVTQPKRANQIEPEFAATQPQLVLLYC
jgi:hypothetical protein